MKLAILILNLTVFVTEVLNPGSRFIRVGGPISSPLSKLYGALDVATRVKPKKNAKYAEVSSGSHHRHKDFLSLKKASAAHKSVAWERPVFCVSFLYILEKDTTQKSPPTGVMPDILHPPIFA